MKRFTFPLQKILDLREYEEEQAKLDLASAIADANRIQAELDYVAREMVAAGAVRITSDIPAMQANEAYKVRLKLRKGELIEELAQAELVIEQKREVFAEKMRDRKVITKLKDKAVEEYKAEVEKEEQQINDDVSNARFARELSGVEK